MPSQAQRRAKAKGKAKAMPKPENFEKYARQLYEQPQKNICPKCYANGSRKRHCKNMVLLDDKLVCCWLGDRDEISEAAFQAKIREMQNESSESENDCPLCQGSATIYEAIEAKCLAIARDGQVVAVGKF